jgi:hypothetical protein
MPVMDEPQTTLLDLKTITISPYWVDPKQDLIVPVNPLHYKAHKLQLLLQRLDFQAEKNGAQFNSSTYLAVLNEYTKCIELINKGETSDVMGQDEMVSFRVEATKTIHSDLEPISMDT